MDASTCLGFVLAYREGSDKGLAEERSRFGLASTKKRPLRSLVPIVTTRKFRCVESVN